MVFVHPGIGQLQLTGLKTRFEDKFMGIRKKKKKQSKVPAAGGTGGSAKLDVVRSMDDGAAG